MDTFLYVLLLLIAIFISNLLNRFIPFVSVPLIQIGLGVIIALLPISFELKLNPELFLLLFIAPLLFNDGRRTDRKALWRLKTPILLLALGLVFVTVIIIGYFVHWLIPTIPLAAGFALAAALAPTDAVAVSSLSGRIDLPKKITQLLEGEALMNDASGLTAFQFAIAAMVTGTFSIFQASFSFLVIAIGGILVGLVLSFLKFQFLRWVRGLGMEDVTLHMLIQILTLFLIYLAAEELHTSGILAVVVAGIMHAIESKKMDPQQVRLNVVSKSTWSVIIFVLNSLVFLILGTQLPSIMEVVWTDSGISNVLVITYILLITFALIILRFIWVYGFWFFNNWKEHKPRGTKPQFRASLLTSLSGVRGAVTLATALSIPFFLDDGDSFPQRSLIIFVASGVILCSLIIATFILPILARKDEVNSTNERDERAVRIKILRLVLRKLHEQITPENKTATERVMQNYRKRIRELQKQGTNSRMTEFEKTKRLEIIKWERDNTEKLLDQKKITAEVAYRYLYYLNLMEAILKQKLKTRIKTAFHFLRRFLYLILHLRKWYKLRSKLSKTPVYQSEAFKELKWLRVTNEKYVIDRLKKEVTKENAELLNPLIMEHLTLLEKTKNLDLNPQQRNKVSSKEREMDVIALQIERDTIQQMFESGKISRELARDLRQNLNLLETYLYEEEIA